MHMKKDFYRLLGAKLSFDDDLFWCFHYWYKKEFGENSEFYSIVDVIGWPKDGEITLRFDNDENKQWTLPISAMFHKDDQQEAVMLWYSNFYDGPLSGLAEYDGKKVWFECTEGEDSNLFNMRVFGLYELSNAELEYEEKHHQHFRDNVGHHCDYVEGKKGKVNYTQESFDRYYAEAKEEPDRDYTKNKLIIELDESYFKRGYPKKEVDNG